MGNKNIEGTTVTCNNPLHGPEGYTWKTRSKALLVCCPRCNRKIKIDANIKKAKEKYLKET